MHAWALASLRVLRPAWIARPVMIRRGSGAVNFISAAAFAVATPGALRHAPTTGGRPPADEPVPDAPRAAGGSAPAHHHHGVLRLERRGRVGHHRGALPEPALVLAPARQHRSGGVLPLRPLAPVRALQAGFPDRAGDHLAGHRVL